MNDFFNDYFIRSSNEHEEKIIEKIEQGYNYIAIKQEIHYYPDKNSAKMTYKYLGLNDLVHNETFTEVLREEGFCIYDLSKVKEHLNTKDNL